MSQTAGPETVLCGEAELPYALLGYATDYANGVQAQATPLAELLRLIDASSGVFERVLSAALSQIGSRDLRSPGTVYRFEQ